MRSIVLLFALLVGLGSYTVVASGKASSLRAQLRNITTGVRDFVRPTSNHHSGLQNMIAGLTLASMTCVGGMTGCASMHTDEDIATAMRWHKAGVFTGVGLTLGGVSYAALEKEKFKPLSHVPTVMVFTGIGLAVGTSVWSLVVTRNVDWATVATGDADTDTWLADRTTIENADALALRNYLRANLSPSTRALFADIPADSWVAVPVKEEQPFSLQSYPVAEDIATLLENADVFYHGQLDTQGDQPLFVVDEVLRR